MIQSFLSSEKEERVGQRLVQSFGQLSSVPLLGICAGDGLFLVEKCLFSRGCWQADEL